MAKWAQGKPDNINFVMGNDFASLPDPQPLARNVHS